MDGEKIYNAAVLMTDRYQKRFQDMLTADLLESEIERQYFVKEFDWLPMMGWQEFCAKMQDAGQSEWLTKIARLDEEVLLATMERRLLEALDGRLLDSDGRRVVDKDALDACAKAIQGLVGRSKILSEQRSFAASNNEIIIKIIESKHDDEVGGNCEKLAKEGSNGGRT